jgi:hypothetical protein
MPRLARSEAFVTSFHLLDDFVRSHLVALFLGEVRVGQHAPQTRLYYPDSCRNPGGFAEVPAVKSISSVV